MKIIFLDVDGVLNSQDDLRIFREKNNITGCIMYAEVEDRPLKLLKEIVDKTSAKIVLSSSWRTGCERCNATGDILGHSLFTKLKNKLAAYGMTIYDLTPCISGAERGAEIRDWLSENPVDNFIILDDDDDMCEYKDTEHFIHTTYLHGLTEELKERAIEVLMK